VPKIPTNTPKKTKKKPKTQGDRVRPNPPKKPKKNQIPPKKPYRVINPIIAAANGLPLQNRPALRPERKEKKK